MILTPAAAREKARELLRETAPFSHSPNEPEHLIAAALLAAQAAAVETCQYVAATEEEPRLGELSPEIISEVLDGNTAYVETALIAAVRSTKKNIASRIRALLPAEDRT